MNYLPILTLLLLPHLTTTLPAQSPLTPNQPRTLELAVGEERELTYIATVDGEASIWARSEHLDVILEVMQDDGDFEKVDDDSGGGTAAHMYFRVTRGAEYTIVVTAKTAAKESDSQPARVALVEAPVDEKTVSLYERLRQAARDMNGLLEERDSEEARRRGRSVELSVFWSSEIWPSSIARALNSLANRAKTAGDIELAKECWELVVAVYKRTLPPEHLVRLVACHNLALELSRLGDLISARAIQEDVLAAYERTLPADHRELLKARGNLAVTLRNLGDIVGARSLQENVLAVYERTRPAHDAELQTARMSLASTIRLLGDNERACTLQRKVLAVRERVLPSDHRLVQITRLNLAGTVADLGDLLGARELQEKAVAVFERALPPDHRDLQSARHNLATTLFELGDVSGARSIQQQVLAVFERTLPSDHPLLQSGRKNLAVMFTAMGDFDGARTLQELVLAANERTLPEDHPDLQSARLGLAVTLLDLGELDEARKLEEQALAVYERILPADSTRLQTARVGLGVTLSRLGKTDRARALQEQALAVLKRTLPEDHPGLQTARQSLALTLHSLGTPPALKEAKRLQEQVLATQVRILPDDSHRLEDTRQHLAVTLLDLAELEPDEFRDVFAEYAVSVLRKTNEWADRSIGASSERQMSQRVADLRSVLAFALNSWSGGGKVGKDVFELTERLRGLGPRSRRLLNQGRAMDATTRKLHAEIVSRRRDLASFLASPAGDGTAGGASISTRLAALVRAKEHAEVALAEALVERPESAELVRSVASSEIAASLPPDARAVSFSSYPRYIPSREDSGRVAWEEARHVVAMTLDRSARVARIDLAPADRIRRAIRKWQLHIRGSDSMSAKGGNDVTPDEAGRRLRRLLLDPVLAAFDHKVGRLVVTLSDDMHLVPLDALPLDDGRCVGDAYDIHVVGCLEDLVRRPYGNLNAGGLVGFGFVDYAGRPEQLESPEVARDTRGHPTGGRDFQTLDATRTELANIRAAHDAAFEGEEDHIPPKLFMGREADKSRLRRLAPKARYLHIATHGWFAPESVPSILDKRQLKSLTSPLVSDFRDEVRGYLPLELCGLALAGANLAAGESGSHPGLISGTELAGIDLSGVELAVLSACDTNVGVLRAGQGIMSLQEALLSAGVRYTITSLWRVPDNATMKLMTRFYDGIWRRGETKREALWNAKRMLRDEKLPNGKPRYGLRDWAGWILFGNPE